MTKSEIGAELLRTHQLLWLACDQLAPERQTISYNGKWSALQNLRHITKSVGGVARFLKTDKAILDTKFGQSGRASISPEELHAAYLKVLSGGPVSGPAFAPDAEQNMPDAIAQGKALIQDLVAGLDAWSEPELDSQVCPHPVLGPLTLREMLYFSAFHATHHQAAVDRIAAMA